MLTRHTTDEPGPRRVLWASRSSKKQPTSSYMTRLWLACGRGIRSSQPLFGLHEYRPRHSLIRLNLASQHTTTFSLGSSTSSVPLLPYGSRSPDGKFIFFACEHLINPRNCVVIHVPKNKIAQASNVCVSHVSSAVLPSRPHFEVM